jgi:hypothetical protein
LAERNNRVAFGMFQKEEAGQRGLVVYDNYGFGALGAGASG